MLNPGFDRAFELLSCFGEANGPTRDHIAEQLDSLPVYAASLDRDGAVIFQNKKQRGRDIPGLSAVRTDFVDIIHSDGETVLYSAVAKKNQGGEPAGFLLVGAEVEHELTRLQFEKALSDKIRLSELVDKSPVITVMIIPNKSMDVIFVSGNIEKLGYSRDRFYLNRLSWLDVVYPEDRLKFSEEVMRFVRISVRFSYKYRIVTASGKVVHVQSDMTVMRDASGRPMYFEGTVTDITDQIELEMAIADSTEQYDSRLRELLEPSPDGHEETKLLEILSPQELSAQFEHIAGEYGLFFMLRDSDSGSIGAWTPRSEDGGPGALAECERRMDPMLMYAMKEMLPERKHQIVSRNGLNAGMTAIYIGSRMAAYCCFCRAEGAELDEGDFESICELVNIVCESMSEDCTQSIELMRQVDRTHLLREATDRDFEEQVLVNELITKLYESGSNSETISEMLSLVGERLGVSRVYLYEPSTGGRFCITHEWAKGDFLRLPPEANNLPDKDILPREEGGAAFVVGRGEPLFEFSGAVSALHYPINNAGKLCGVIGVADCANEREWRRDFLSSVFKVVAEAVLWKNSKFNAALMFGSLSSMLENINALVFVADYHSQRVLFANSMLLNTIGAEKTPSGGMNGLPQFPDFLGGLLSAGHISDSDEYLLGGRWYKKTLTPIDWTDGRKAQLVCLFDIHELKEQELRIEYTAYHDPLLGTYNRRKFESDLERAVGQAEHRAGALILLDLDDFKYINDAYGHDKGDEVLKRFIDTLRPILGEGLYRYGGDEFMALLPGIKPARLRELVNETVHTLQAAVSGSNEDVMCTASIGVARYPQDGHIPQDILRSVDMAMYQAKQEGKGSAVFFTPNMETSSHRHNNLDKLLKREVEQGCPNMSLLYQPMFNTASGELFGVEALLRWKPPGLGTVMPEEFVGMAEMLGLMYDIGNMVLDRAVTDAVEMRSRGLDITVSVNMFMRQLQSAGLADSVLALLENRRCPPGTLMLEMTERMTLYDHQRKISQIARLRSAGVLICADDFGSGQSSSAHLRERLWNLVKIDCKGIRDIHVDHYMRTFVKTRVKIAHAAGVLVCAEGVENEEQRALLAAFECDYIQGYLMDYPIPVEAVLEKYAPVGR